MRLFAAHTQFFRDESGAVTVDYVVLTAAVLAVGIGVLSSVGGGTIDFSSALSDHIEAIEVGVGDGASGGTTQSAGSAGSSGGGGSEPSSGGVGNPGNDRNVGGAGETPNGGDDWGSGSNGQSS